MQQKDQRIRLTSEVLNGIKVIKLYAWEDHFQSDVQNIRNNELAVLRKIAYLNAGLSFSWLCAPFMVSKFMRVFIFEGLYVHNNIPYTAKHSRGELSRLE